MVQGGQRHARASNVGFSIPDYVAGRVAAHAAAHGKAERMSALPMSIGVLLDMDLGSVGTVLALPMPVIVKFVADHVEPLGPWGRLTAP